MSRRLAGLFVGLGLSMAASPEVRASDKFARGALILSPSDAPLSNRWLVSLGLDKPVNLEQTLYVGIEIQSAIYKVSTPAGSATVIPLNGFLNVKFKTATVGLRPFAGAGFGVPSTLTSSTGGKSFDPDLGFHLLAGTEWGKLTFEFQIARTLDTGAKFNYIVLAGLTF